MKGLVLIINKLTLENKQLKHKSVTKTSTFTWIKTKTAAIIKFYTSIVLFNKRLGFIQSFLSDIIYWNGLQLAKNFIKVWN